MLDISPSTVANYWKAERAWPVEVLPFVANALGTGVADFLGADGVTSRHLPVHTLTSAQKPEDTVPIREIDLSYGMGATYLDVPITEEIHNFPRAWVRRYTRSSPDDLFFAQGIGDSMQPTLYDSDLLLIDTAQRQLNMSDRIWVIAYAECGSIRRLRPVPDGGVAVIADNPAIPPVTAYDGELEIIGRVVAVQRRL